MRFITTLVIGAGQAGLAMSRALSRRDVDHLVLDRGAVANAWREDRWDSLRLLTPNWANGLPGDTGPVPDPDGYMRVHELVGRMERYAQAVGAPVQTQTDVRRVSGDDAGLHVETSQGPYRAKTVVLASGACARLPRTYRGRDVEYWLDAIGALDERHDEVDDLERARRTPSPQLIGGPEPVDLNALQDCGVEIVGRLADIREGKALFSGGLANVCASADLKMNRLLDAIDAWATERGLDEALPAPDRPEPTRLPDAPALSRSLTGDGIRTIVWATGYRPDFSWLDMPVFDVRGRLRHHGGVVSHPGLYAMGLTFMRRRKSHQISGVGGDAHELSAHLRGYLDGRTGIAA